MSFSDDLKKLSDSDAKVLKLREAMESNVRSIKIDLIDKYKADVTQLSGVISLISRLDLGDISEKAKEVIRLGGAHDEAMGNHEKLCTDLFGFGPGDNADLVKLFSIISQKFEEKKCNLIMV